MDGTSLLMTMSSCLSLGSNLELRWWKSALVFLDDTKSTGCQRAALWHHRYPTARLMHRSVRKIKEMNAGATSRALPMGNRFPLKAWQREGGNKQTKKKNTPLLCGYFRRVLMSPVGEWVKSPFFPFLTTHPSLALWVIIEKKICTAILCFILTVFTAATTIFHTLKRYSKFIFLFFFWSPEDSHSAQYKKGKETKRKNWSQNLQKNLLLLLLIYQQLIQNTDCNKTVTKNTLKISFMKQFLTVPFKELPLYIFSP